MAKLVLPIGVGGEGGDSVEQLQSGEGLSAESSIFTYQPDGTIRRGIGMGHEGAREGGSHDEGQPGHWCMGVSWARLTFGPVGCLEGEG